MKPIKPFLTPTALITGGARRIGAAIVQILHQAGYCIIIHCHYSTTEAHLLANSLNNKRPESVHVVSQDLGAPNAAKVLKDAVIDWSGRLDLLVNNASQFFRTDCDSQGWDLLFDVNVKLPFLLSLELYSLLAEQQGSIINITDIHADKPLSGYSIYCQSKAALEMQTKSLAQEFAPLVRVNAIAPGAIAWPEQTNQLSTIQKDKIIQQTPLKKHGDPLFIAQMVLALCENPFITGETVKVDGGRSLK